MKGSNSMILLALLSVIIGFIVLATMAKEFVMLADEDIQLITEKHTNTMRDIMIVVNTMEQDVRYYDIDNSFDVTLNETHLELKYVGSTRTMADDTMEVHRYSLKHHIENIKNIKIRTKPRRICISKKMINCVPEITICEEGGSCCDIQSNNCKYVN